MMMEDLKYEIVIEEERARLSPLHDGLLVLLLLRMCLLQLAVVEHVVHGNGSATHDIVRQGAVWSGAGFRSVREGQPGCVDDSVVPYKRNRNLCRLPDPLPTAPELRDVRYDAEHALLASVHGLGLNVAEPDAKVRGEVLAGQLEHRRFASTVQLEEKKVYIIETV